MTWIEWKFYSKILSPDSRGFNIWLLIWQGKDIVAWKGGKRWKESADDVWWHWIPLGWTSAEETRQLIESDYEPSDWIQFVRRPISYGRTVFTFSLLSAAALYLYRRWIWQSENPLGFFPIHFHRQTPFELVPLFSSAIHSLCLMVFISCLYNTESKLCMT